MKHLSLLASVLCLFLILNFSNVFAQGHSLQLDDGATHYSIIKGSTTGGIYTLGIGGGTILTTGSSLGNTSDNPLGGDNQGVAVNGINWQVNGTGYIATLSNLSAAANADGLQIAVASATGNGRALLVTTGGNFNPTGGAGVRNEVFTVMNNGNLITTGSMTMGYAEVASGATPAAPLGASVYLVKDNTVAASPATITLPAGAPNGSLVTITTNDPDGATELTTAFTFARAQSGRFIKTSDGWKAEF